MKTVTVRLTAADFLYLSQEAQRLRLSLSSVIRMRLSEVIDNPTPGIREMLPGGMRAAGK